MHSRGHNSHHPTLNQHHLRLQLSRHTAAEAIDQGHVFSFGPAEALDDGSRGDQLGEAVDAHSASHWHQGSWINGSAPAAAAAAAAVGEEHWPRSPQFAQVPEFACSVIASSSSATADAASHDRRAPSRKRKHGSHDGDESDDKADELDSSSDSFVFSPHSPHSPHSHTHNKLKSTPEFDLLAQEHRPVGSTSAASAMTSAAAQDGAHCGSHLTPLWPALPSPSGPEFAASMLPMLSEHVLGKFRSPLGGPFDFHATQLSAAALVSALECASGLVAPRQMPPPLLTSPVVRRAKGRPRKVYTAEEEKCRRIRKRELERQKKANQRARERAREMGIEPSQVVLPFPKHRPTKTPPPPPPPHTTCALADAALPAVDRPASTVQSSLSTHSLGVVVAAGGSLNQPHQPIGLQPLPMTMAAMQLPLVRSASESTALMAPFQPAGAGLITGEYALPWPAMHTPSPYSSLEPRLMQSTHQQHQQHQQQQLPAHCPAMVKAVSSSSSSSLTSAASGSASTSTRASTRGEMAQQVREFLSQLQSFECVTEFVDQMAAAAKDRIRQLARDEEARRSKHRLSTNITRAPAEQVQSEEQEEELEVPVESLEDSFPPLSSVGAAFRTHSSEVLDSGLCMLSSPSGLGPVAAPSIDPDLLEAAHPLLLDAPSLPA